MNKSKGVSLAFVIFWGLILLLKIPAVGKVYDRLLEAVTGVPVTKAALQTRREAWRDLATGNRHFEPFETAQRWGRTTGQPTQDTP
jgi:hypothetical protein